LFLLDHHQVHAGTRVPHATREVAGELSLQLEFFSRSTLHGSGHVLLPNRVLVLCMPCAPRHQVSCSPSRVVPGAHGVVGPSTHLSSGPRDVRTTHMPLKELRPGSGKDRRNLAKGGTGLAGEGRGSAKGLTYDQFGGWRRREVLRRGSSAVPGGGGRCGLNFGEQRVGQGKVAAGRASRDAFEEGDMLEQLVPGRGGGLAVGGPMTDDGGTEQAAADCARTRKLWGF
jgi:hypothetical protein